MNMERRSRRQTNVEVSLVRSWPEADIAAWCLLSETGHFEHLHNPTGFDPKRPLVSAWAGVNWARLDRTGSEVGVVKVTFIGTGDAFGSGGRLQTCILVDGAGIRFAIDFGASSLIGLRRQGIEPNTIDVIVITHLHGDHCGGVPFLLLDAMLGSKRKSPLTIVGPTGSEPRLRAMQEVLFPGSEAMKPNFALQFVEVVAHSTMVVAGLVITGIEARHTKETNPLAVRIQVGDRSIAYTGDGERTEELAKLVSGVDLLIAESYFFDKPIRWHMNYPDLAGLTANRTVLTHMHSNMLEHVDEVPEDCAYDGYEIKL